MLLTFLTYINYVNQHWKQFIWDVIKNTVVWFSLIVGFSDSILEVMPEHSALYKELRFVWDYVFDHPVVLLLLLLFILTMVLISKWPRPKAIYKDETTDIKVIIECCDLLKQDGLKIIHSVDTFDTALGRVISPRSLHGSFLSEVQKQGIDIDALIERSLVSTPIEATDDSLPVKKNRYQLGTICPIELGKEDYALVSFSHLQSDGTIAIRQQEYMQFMMQMWKNLANPKIRHDEINVAVMGNKFVDLPSEFSTEQKIDIMLQTFFVAARERSCCKTLRICVHSSNITEVDFGSYPSIIKHLAKRPML